MAMNRRQFLLFRTQRQHTVELSGEQLYMRYVDSTLNGNTSQFFKGVEQSLSNATSLHLTGTDWLNCEELKPVQSLLAAFRDRGGRIE